MNRKPSTAAAPSRAITKEDVARAAGVSHITVSRVINTPEKVAPATRERVEAFISSMGYIPNMLAGGLASRRTRIVAAIVPTISHSIFAETVRGLSEQLSLQGYQLLLGQTNYSEEAETGLVEAFIGRRVDGLVLTGVQHSVRTRQRLRAAGIPVVETWDLTPQPIDMLVGFDNHAAGYAMGQYLHRKGYRRMAFVGGEDPRGLARFAGMREALLTQSAPEPAHLVMPMGSFLQAGREAICRLLALEPAIDAAFFSNDVLAAGAALECARRAIAVPQRIALAGFANLEIAPEVLPALTTVQISAHQIGLTAAEMLLTRFEGDAVAQPVCDLGYAILERDST
ncbi:LacI family DNA-binding transcriptional regulator [Herbaspirillum sp. AP02]|uniref:LacI family DNA-binding transcriptional regulator n=1 Tax=unclassified Herbaspirillum TaxID=2624150 RepID=UPI0015DA7FB0|nr:MULTISPECIES: LacI family DNA-binding transcriptional regulator [unclassified Herbaspirillum]MBG7618544.1 LacI family DNA-binding transcriptional regulator [Herbaspirillum sp. AP02]NZD68704.1 LacI family DNA-binding transcriptional regulator [Herbaspirillum sp. AP21]